MNRTAKSYFIFFLFLLLSACSKNSILNDLERIKTIGNENPQMALSMLDSLEVEVRSESEYVQSKYDLLKIRLNDKAMNIHTSDIVIKKLIEYFEKHGSDADKQEVYYYAGSVYRDLQDTPRAIKYFLTSLDSKGRDSIMLRNTYSNLSYLYYQVQDYYNDVKMAKEELRLCKQLKNNIDTAYMHVGTAYMALDSTKQAKEAFDKVYLQITKSPNKSESQYLLPYLLDSYIYLGEHAKAKECFKLIKTDPLKNYSAYPCLIFAQYYESIGKIDSAIIYADRILDDGTDISNMYDAAKLIYGIYSEAGDINHAYKYANIYMQLSDSLDFGKRQEQAATVNNAFKYNLDQKRELKLKKEKKRYKYSLIVLCLFAFIIICVGYVIYVQRRNRHLQKIIALSSELQRISEDGKQLRADIAQKEEELSKSSGELERMKSELHRVNRELEEYDETLKSKEQLLKDKMEQNRIFMRMLHQSDFEEKAEDVISTVREAAKGKKEMTSSDWKKLYHAVDTLYPSFKDKLLKDKGTVTEQQMQVCYLMRIGLSGTHIHNLTGLSRTTIWRWEKSLRHLLSGVRKW